MKSTRKWLIGSIVVIVLAVAAYLSTAQDLFSSDSTATGNGAQAEEKPAVGYRAPSFELESFDGKRVKLADLQGKPVVLNFWASWCGPCRNEMPDLESVHQKYGDKVQVYGVNLTSQDDLNNAKAFFKEMGVSFPSLMDADEKVAQAYRTFSIPMTYGIDQNGVISEIHKGQITKVVMDGMMQRLVAASGQ